MSKGIALCAALLSACAPSHAPAPATSPLAALPTPLVLAPDAPPQILAVQLSDPVFHSGETITGTVVTSTNVAGVQVQLQGHAANVPRTQPGVFELSYTMPHIPFFMRGTYTAQVVARNADGLTAQRDISVAVR